MLAYDPTQTGKKCLKSHAGFGRTRSVHPDCHEIHPLRATGNMKLGQGGKGLRIFYDFAGLVSILQERLGTIIDEGISSHAR